MLVFPTQTSPIISTFTIRSFLADACKIHTVQSNFVMINRLIGSLTYNRNFEIILLWIIRNLA